jgi:hypothetical protein
MEGNGMKRLAIGVAMFISLAVLAQGPEKTPPGQSAVNPEKAAGSKSNALPAKVEMLHGWVVDEVCGRVTGRTSEHATCARMCSRLMHKTLVFVSDYNGVNVKVRNPETLKPYLGKHLDIEARLIAPREIEVLHVDIASASASPNDPVAAHDNAPLIPTAEWKKPVWATADNAQQQKKAK